MQPMFFTVQFRLFKSRAKSWFKMQRNPLYIRCTFLWFGFSIDFLE